MPPPMKVYFLRHGEADWPGWDRPDDERPLTKKGKKEMKRVADFLAGRDVILSVILSSPLPRAYQTAEVVAERIDREVSEEPALAPGFSPKKLAVLLKEHAGQDVMLVGHEPSFSEAIAALTGGNVKLPKAAVARVDLDDPQQLRGQLIWLITPKLIK
jgi:phosphohistidine phosphatase